MLIFSSKHRLHLLLKLLAADECLNIFPLICGDSPCSFRPQKYFDKAVWYLSFGLENECLWLYHLCFQFPAEIPIYSAIRRKLKPG